MTNKETSKELSDLKNIGDHKLDTQEIAYLRGKPELFVNDVDKLNTDIADANRDSFNKDEKCRYLLDSYVNNPSLLLKQLHLEKDQASFEKAIAQAKDPFEKRIVIIKKLLSIVPGHKDTVGVDGVFTNSLIKEIHRFQKKYEGVAGWSKADCIIGFRTVQQLLSELGVNTAIDRSVDAKFSSSHATAKEKYIWAAELQKQMDAIKNDKGLNNIAKVTALIDVYKKTISDKKYAAASYLMQTVQGLYAYANPLEQAAIKTLISDPKLNIKSNRNASTSNQINQIKKSDDLLADMDDQLEQKEKNNHKIAMIENIAEGWLKYLSTEAPKGYKIVQKSILEGRAMLKNAYNKTATLSDAYLMSALNKIFFSTETKDVAEYEFPNLSGPALMDALVKPLPKGKELDYEFCGRYNKQIQVLNEIKKLMIGNGDPLVIRQNVLSKIRYIDAKLDGVWASFSYNSGEGIKSEMQSYNQSMNNELIKDGKESITSMKLNNKEGVNYNKEMGQVHTFFDKLTNGTDEEKKDSTMKLNNLRTLILHDKPVYKQVTHVIEHGMKEIENVRTIPLSESLKAAYADMGITFPLSEAMAEYLYDEVIKIDKKIPLNKIEEQVKQGLGETKTELTRKIAFYKGEAENNPSKKDQYLKTVSYLENMITEIDGGIKGGTMNTIPGFEGKTIYQIAALQRLQLSNVAFAQTLEQASMKEVMIRNKQALKLNQKKSDAEKMIDLYATIEGYGGHLSDSTYNVLMEFSKELVIQVVVAAVSMGVANVVMAEARGIMLLGKLGNYGVKLGKYMEMAEGSFASIIKNADSFRNTGVSLSRLAVTKAGALALEGSVFHVSSTVMSNFLHGEKLATGLDDAHGYLQSIAFLGVLKEVSSFMTGKLLNGKLTAGQEALMSRLSNGESLTFAELKQLPTQLPQGLSWSEAQLKGLKNSKIDLSKIQKFRLNGPTLSKIIDSIDSMGVEMGSLMTTEQIISFAETGHHKEWNIKDLSTMFGMILGLRGINKIKKALIIKEVKTDTAGNVTDVTIDVEGQVIEVQKALKLKEDISKRVKEGIDNYDSTPGQKKLQNRIKWQEKQSVYESHFTQAQKFLNEPAYADVITENMKTMAAADGSVELSSNDIKRVQREVGLQGKDVDGVLGPDTLTKIREFIAAKKGVDIKTISIASKAPTYHARGRANRADKIAQKNANKKSAESTKPNENKKEEDQNQKEEEKIKVTDISHEGIITAEDLFTRFEEEGIDLSQTPKNEVTLRDRFQKIIDFLSKGVNWSKQAIQTLRANYKKNIAANQAYTAPTRRIIEELEVKLDKVEEQAKDEAKEEENAENEGKDKGTLNDLADAIAEGSLDKKTVKVYCGGQELLLNHVKGKLFDLISNDIEQLQGVDKVMYDKGYLSYGAPNSTSPIESKLKLDDKVIFVEDAKPAPVEEQLPTNETEIPIESEVKPEAELPKDENIAESEIPVSTSTNSQPKPKWKLFDRGEATLDKPIPEGFVDQTDTFVFDNKVISDSMAPLKDMKEGDQILIVTEGVIDSPNQKLVTTLQKTVNGWMVIGTNVPNLLGRLRTEVPSIMITKKRFTLMDISGDTGTPSRSPIEKVYVQKASQTEKSEPVKVEEEKIEVPHLHKYERGQKIIIRNEKTGELEEAKVELFDEATGNIDVESKFKTVKAEDVIGLVPHIYGYLEGDKVTIKEEGSSNGSITTNWEITSFNSNAGIGMVKGNGQIKLINLSQIKGILPRTKVPQQQ